MRSRGASGERAAAVTVYIDRPDWPGHGRLWAHMVSDESYEELHAFAAQLGIPRRAFERDHYDVVAERHPQAVAAGARLVTSREIVERLNASGLRRRKLSRARSSRPAGSVAPTELAGQRETLPPDGDRAPRD